MIRPVSDISGYHAHVYYAAETRPNAETLRNALNENFDVTLGRWHDNPIGPHSTAMYQVIFKIADFGVLVPWLMINRNNLNILVHPETGDDLEDHTENALWLGQKLDLDLSAF